MSPVSQQAARKAINFPFFVNDGDIGPNMAAGIRIIRETS